MINTFIEVAVYKIIIQKPAVFYILIVNTLRKEFGKHPHLQKPQEKDNTSKSKSKRLKTFTKTSLNAKQIGEGLEYMESPPMFMD